MEGESMGSGEIKEELKEQTGDETQAGKHNIQNWKGSRVLMGFHSRNLLPHKTLGQDDTRAQKALFRVTNVVYLHENCNTIDSKVWRMSPVHTFVFKLRFHWRRRGDGGQSEDRQNCRRCSKESRRYEEIRYTSLTGLYFQRIFKNIFIYIVLIIKDSWIQ